MYAVWALDEDGDEYPDYNEDKYTLSYDGNGNTSGTAPAAEEHVEDAAVTLADKGDLVRTQATFLGWSLTQNELIESQEAEEAAGIITELTMPGADETVYAVWASDIDEDGTPDYEDDKYDLTYDANGGEGGPGTVADAYLNTQTVTLETTNVPTMEKAKFLGWSKTKTSIYKDAAPGEGVLITSITFGENDETVYAVWASDIDGDGEPDYEETKYDLNYDVNGGQNGPANVPDAYINGQTVTLNTDTFPTRDGAVFIGWSESLIEGVLTEEPAEETVVTEVTFGEADKTVYAVWALDEDGDEYPDYNEDKYTLSYDGNGNTSGTAPAAEEHVEDAAVTLADKGDLVRTQATFLGWSLTQNELIESQEAEEAAGIITELTMPGADETVYAVWASDIDEDGTPDYEDDKYDLTYDANGGEGGPGTVADAYLNKQTVTLNMETVPTMEKAKFLGWSMTQESIYKDAAPGEGVLITSITFGENDETVYAVWASDIDGDGEPDYEETKYDLNYDVNGGQNGPANVPDAYINGQTVTLDTDTFPTRDGAVFIGWSESLIEGVLTEAPAEGTVVTEVTFGEEDKTVYAVWALDEDGDEYPDYNEDKYTLSYDGNGNTSGTAPAAEEHVEDAAVTLADKGDLVRTQATFLGWSLTQNELIESQEAEEAAGIITELTMPGEDETVYAVWASDENNNGQPDYEEPLVNITFDVVDTTKGYFETAGRRTITVELLPGIELPTPSSFVDVEGDEWTLDGWMNNGQEVTVVPKTDMIVTANWAEDKNQNNEPDVDEEWVSITFDAVDTARGYFGNGEQTRTFKMLPGAPLLSPAGFVDVLGDNWTLDYWTLNGQEVTVVPNTDATVLAHWAEDTNHNNQPDEDESYSLTITYAYAQGEEGSAALPAVNRQNDLAVGHAYSVASPEIEGYVAVPAVVSGTISDRDVSATVLYYIDSNGNDVPDSQEPDDGGNGGGGGSSDEDDDDGGSGGTGGGTTGGGTAADTTTGTGTTPGAGTGAAPAPVTTVTIAADDADAADTADDADAAEGADEDYALEEVGEDTENAAEDEESVATINEDETPLANQQIHSPVCILHWLILLAALIIAVIFIWDGHNRKKRIEELKKELGMK